jgi:hypothetical protein
LKSLRKEAGERFQSGKELMEALEDALFSQPATLTELPGRPGAYPPPTLAEIPAIRRTRPKPEVLSPDGDVTKVKEHKPLPQRTRYMILGGLGCGLLLLICSALLVRGAALLLDQRNTPTITQQMDVPAATSSVPALMRTATSTSTATLTSTRKPASKPTRTPTLIATSTPTLTPTPTSTPVGTYELLIAAYRDDSLFVVNEGEGRFPLEPLEFRNRYGGVVGEEWKVEFLERGDCIALWKEEGRPKAPKDLDCDEVGERLERSGAGKFWIFTFDVYYLGEKIGTCAPLSGECTALIEIIQR